MVARNEQFHHDGTPPRLQGTGYGLQRVGISVEFYNLQRSMITDQKFGISDDLFIDHCSLVIERSARNRNYDPSLGRWINQDPVGYINGANTYQFVMGNPVNAVDPWGLDAAVLISPGEAAGAGHAAIIIGNDQTGWDYYSKNGRTGWLSLWGGNEGRHEHFNTLAGFFAAKGHKGRYPEWIRIPTPPGVDKAMRGWAKNHVYTPYYAWGPSCAALVQGTLHAGGIPTGNIGLFNGWGPGIPNNLFENLENEGLAGDLGYDFHVHTPGPFGDW